MFVTETKIRVRYAETDPMNVVYHGNYAQYFETARAESIRHLGFTYREMEAMGIIMPIVEIHCRFLRPARYDDLLTVKAIVKELPASHRIEFHHEVFNEQQQLLATGRVVLYFVDAGTMERSRMPQELYDRIKGFFEAS